ncbi:hypothetical protein A1O3_00552 [Capronia epimyces CBS 606.96]|uniref:Apc15p protein-domain-containing protein n=1 Tax=Capronia epimyces CBS 606.96 TaxID=1182542 RepID=W9YGI4_9EURO|nr:uncharacterized protein A1O3_00552 [Capronia epimyces CBS 606.96]EXJ92002.1 hypothetical protein A1O3_00552 [Capronia epimyces CBS 606.96]
MALHRNSALATLSADERTIVQRKMAIAMYGYSWLKPAGCAKTMLGRREEELEREEVERQLREVEMQERIQQEADEQERLARLGEMGEPEGERDLDEDIPDADPDEEGDEDEDDPYDDFEEEAEEDGMEGDLDDEIPDADEDDENDDEIMSPDPETANADWIYDTRREPDTDEEEGALSPAHPGRARVHANISVAGVYITDPGSGYDYDERDAEDLADAMLDEDEIFDHQNADPGERDLDEEIPEAESEQGWEHTDTELEASEMDISMLASGQIHPAEPASRDSSRRISGRHVADGSRRASGRRSSGPWITGLSRAQSPGQPGLDSARYSRPTPASVHVEPRARVISGNRAHAHAHAHQQHQYIQTPVMLDSPLEVDLELDGELDPFVSSRRATTTRNMRRGMPRSVTATAGPDSAASSRTDTAGLNVNVNENPSRTTAARNWLDGAAAAVGGSARRTLFGRAVRRANAGTVNTAATDTTAASSGGLFTPSPATEQPEGTAQDWETPVSGQASQESGQGRDQRETRTRSGRFLSGRRRER